MFNYFAPALTCVILGSVGILFTSIACCCSLYMGFANTFSVESPLIFTVTCLNAEAKRLVYHLFLLWKCRPVCCIKGAQGGMSAVLLYLCGMYDCSITSCACCGGIERILKCDRFSSSICKVLVLITQKNWKSEPIQPTNSILCI